LKNEAGKTMQTSLSKTDREKILDRARLVGTSDDLFWAEVYHAYLPFQKKAPSDWDYTSASWNADNALYELYHSALLTPFEQDLWMSAFLDAIPYEIDMLLRYGPYSEKIEGTAAWYQAEMVLRKYRCGLFCTDQQTFPTCEKVAP
jgi:hypothetical protein